MPGLIAETRTDVATRFSAPDVLSLPRQGFWSGTQRLRRGQECYTE
jgi:hypothetical protein